MQGASSTLWVPSQQVAFLWLLVPRVLGAFLMHITDCDETYNYWEPVSICRVFLEVEYLKIKVHSLAR